MPKNISKIYQRTAFMILAIMVSSLLNICLFVLQAKAAMPQATAPKINFAYEDGDACVMEPMPEPTQAFNRPAAPMPECCLAQNRNFNAMVNTANDKTAPAFTGLIISQSDDSVPKNNFSYYTSRLIYPPPALLALASTIIRE